jgi:hypothetical protein
VCNGSETCNGCAPDCGACPYCGDGVCNGDEDTINCVGDCGTECGDGVCNGDEDCNVCDGDCGACPFCGDDFCDGDDTTANCPADCGTSCGDDACNGEETCSLCPGDCGACAGTCEDGIQNQDELGIDCGGVCVFGTEYCGDNADNDFDCSVDNASCGDRNIRLSKFNFSPRENMAPYLSFFNTRSSLDWVCAYTLTEENEIIDSVTRSWMYITGSTVKAPNSPGKYELRYFYDDSWGPGGGSATYGSSDVIFWVKATCSDGIQNQLEQGVDCDGPCSPCATGSDG